MQVDGRAAGVRCLRSLWPRLISIPRRIGPYNELGGSRIVGLRLNDGRTLALLLVLVAATLHIAVLVHAPYVLAARFARYVAANRVGAQHFMAF